MHIVSKFQIFIQIFTVVKPKNKNQNLKNGEKGALINCFMIKSTTFEMNVLGSEQLIRMLSMIILRAVSGGALLFMKLFRSL